MRLRAAFVTVVTIIVTATGLALPQNTPGAPQVAAAASDVRITPLTLKSRNVRSQVVFKGKITWYGMRKARITGFLNDECPGDTAAGSLQIFRNQYWLAEKEVLDDRGCDAPGAVPIKLFLPSGGPGGLQRLSIMVSRKFPMGRLWEDGRTKRIYNPNRY